MRYDEAEVLIAQDHERIARESRDAAIAREIELAREAGPRAPSLRRKAGEAVIALGVRLAGEPRPAPRIGAAT